MQLFQSILLTCQNQYWGNIRVRGAIECCIVRITVCLKLLYYSFFVLFCFFFALRTRELSKQSIMKLFSCESMLIFNLFIHQEEDKDLYVSSRPKKEPKSKVTFYVFSALIAWLCCSNQYFIYLPSLVKACVLHNIPAKVEKKTQSLLTKTK